MRIVNGMISLSIALFAGMLAGCTIDAGSKPADGVSEAALQHGDDRKGCNEPTPPPAECTSLELDAGGGCEDPPKLKDLAYQACLQLGQALADFTYASDDCGWMARKASFTCCAETSPSPAPACTALPLGDGTTCKDLGTIKLEAAAACSAEGMNLVDILLGGGCPDGQDAKTVFTCCE